MPKFADWTMEFADWHDFPGKNPLKINDNPKAKLKNYPILLKRPGYKPGLE